MSVTNNLAGFFLIEPTVQAVWYSLMFISERFEHILRRHHIGVWDGSFGPNNL